MRKPKDKTSPRKSNTKGMPKSKRKSNSQNKWGCLIMAIKKANQRNAAREKDWNTRWVKLMMVILSF